MALGREQLRSFPDTNRVMCGISWSVTDFRLLSGNGANENNRTRHLFFYVCFCAGLYWLVI